MIYSEVEKRAVLTALKSKGFRQPPNWRLVHREKCSEDEISFNHAGLVDRLAEKFRLGDSDLKFAIDVVSNPNERSYLDKGVLKVRFRYVLSAEHQGESKIKGNSREFCVVLINQDKLYRIEDINIMSFRGVNPISKKNYSIFNLRGHWNCRHTWQREIYLVERDNENVSNNELISKRLEMAGENENGLVTKFKSLFSTSKEKLTLSDALKLTQEIVKLTDFKFKDIVVGDKTLRIEGEEIKDGVAVAWVDDKGGLVPVEEPEITVVDGDKTHVLVIKDSAISEIKAPEEKKQPEEMSGELKEGDEITMPNGKVYVITDGVPVLKEDAPKDEEKFSEKKIADLEKKIDDLTKGQTTQLSDFKKTVAEEIAKIPALAAAGTKNGFSDDVPVNPDNKYAHLGGKAIN